MKYIHSLLGSLVAMIVASLVFVFDLVVEAFGFASDYLNTHRTGMPDTEHADRMSQTGKGVWAFVTNLFKVEGRTYTWQAGTIG